MSFQPASVGSGRAAHRQRAGLRIEGLAVDHLELHQVQVDRVTSTVQFHSSQVSVASSAGLVAMGSDHRVTVPPAAPLMPRTAALGAKGTDAATCTVFVNAGRGVVGSGVAFGS